MAAPYTLKWFLMHAKSAHLGEYCRGHRLLEDFPFEDMEDGNIEDLRQAIEALPNVVREECERDFRDIYRLSNRAGRDAIIAASHSKTLQQPGDQNFIHQLGPIGSYQDQAFWSLLTPPELL